MEPVVAGFTEYPNASRRPFFRRRQFLIDRKGQLLATAKIAGVVFALLVLLNLVFSLWNTIETQAIVASNPQLSEELTAIDRRAALVLAVVSLVFLAVVVVRSIRLTHRTAGAAFNLERCLNKVAAGEYDTKFRVRRKDNLRQLQDPFNRMTATLLRQATQDHAELLSLAAKFEELGQGEFAEEARKMAEAKAKLVDPTA